MTIPCSMSGNNAHIGVHIQRLRKTHGWTLADLAARTGRSVSYLSDIERERTDPSLRTLELIASALDMGVGDLLVDAGYTRRSSRYWTVKALEYIQTTLGESDEL